MRAAELMRKMWDEEVVGITNQNKLLTAEEVLARRCSNRPKVLRNVPVEDRLANVHLEESKLPCMKALGVQ